jgi:hypothetical protein
MAVTSARLTTSPESISQDKPNLWLKHRRWDLTFIILSVLFVPVPYIFYLIGVHAFGVHEDVSRNVINGFVAVAVGGPHMMSTFLRTSLDKDFNKRYPMLIRSSIIIPIIVIALAFLNLELLLTIFFFWAMLHVLHQATYVTELYNHKEHKIMQRPPITLRDRAIDYAMLLTCLFPMAAYKISQGSFAIGTNDLTKVIPHMFQDTWFFVAMASIFFVALAAYVIKTFSEIRNGTVNWPKTLFITLTVAIFFPLAAFPNLDTAFQGANMWHSFQYLPLTFYIIKIRHNAGALNASPLVNRMARRGGEENYWGLYMLSAVMLVGSFAVFFFVYFLSGTIMPNIDLNRQFDIAYYTAILSFLWIHYYHDHFLFTDFEALDEARYTS